MAIICCIRYVQCIKHSLVSTFYCRAHHGWTRRKVLKINVLRSLENAFMILVFANTVSHKRAALLSFEVEFTETLLDVLSYPKCTIEPTMVGLEEKFSNKGSQMAGKRCPER